MNIPHNQEAECAVIGGILDYGWEVFAPVSAILEASDFYCAGERLAFELITRAANDGAQDIGLARMLTDWTKTGTPHPPMENWQKFAVSREGTTESARTVAELAYKRRLLLAVDGSRTALQDASTGAESALQPVWEAFDKRAGVDVVGPKEGSRMLVDYLEAAHGRGGAPSGILTGFKEYDALTDGLQRGEMVVIGARPNEGKTAMGLTIAAKAAFESIPTLFISLEMSATALHRRMCGIRTGIDLWKLRRGTFNEGEMQTLGVHTKRMCSTPFFVADGVRGLSASRIAALIRQYARQYGVQVVILDYLQKVLPDKEHKMRTYELGAVSNAIRAAAVTSNVALVALGQLNRDCDKEDRLPRNSDLADSKQIEADADVIALIHRPKDQPDRHRPQTRLFVTKQRDGELGLCNLIFDGRFCRFENPS